MKQFKTKARVFLAAFIFTISSTSFSKGKLPLPPEFQGNSGCFGEKATNLLQMNLILSGKKYVFLSKNNCTNGRTGFIWSAFEYANGKLKVVKSNVTFSQVWYDSREGEEKLFTYHPGNTTSGVFTVIESSNGKIIERKILDVSGNDLQEFLDFIFSLPTLKPTKIPLNKNIKIDFFKKMAAVDRDVRYLDYGPIYSLPQQKFWFPRIIVKNTEEDQCLTVEKHGLRSNPEFPKSKRICHFKSKIGILSLQESQDVEFQNFKWNKTLLDFTLHHVPASVAAMRIEYRCTYDYLKFGDQFQCRRVE